MQRVVFTQTRSASVPGRTTQSSSTSQSRFERQGAVQTPVPSSAMARQRSEAQSSFEAQGSPERPPPAPEPSGTTSSATSAAVSVASVAPASASSAVSSPTSVTTPLPAASPVALPAPELADTQPAATERSASATLRTHLWSRYMFGSLRGSGTAFRRAGSRNGYSVSSGYFPSAFFVLGSTLRAGLGAAGTAASVAGLGTAVTAGFTSTGGLAPDLTKTALLTVDAP